MKAIKWVLTIALLAGFFLPVSLSAGEWNVAVAAPAADALPPGSPTNPFPSNGAANTPVDMTFSWQGGDDPDIPVSYTLHASLNPGGPFADIWGCGVLVATKSCAVAGLTPLTTYYWRVTATDATLLATTSPVWSFTTGKDCYPLTLGVFAGDGLVPVAVPAKSSNCALNGDFNPGEAITLTASPGVGYQVKRWYGTNNNASTSVYNVVTMPAAAHAADVEYELACYSLATSHTGMGTDPAIDTVTSPYTCKTPGSFVNNGYNYLDPVQLANAVPDAGWSIGSWTGLGYASVLPNPVLSMPPTNHVVTVNYGTTCYALTLSYTGTGSAPTATPVKSVGCASDGQFYPGAAISLTAYPGAGFQVGSWLGTNNDASASTTNTLTMPAAPAVAVANYIPGAATASLPIRISLQGRPAAPNAQWATPLTVQFFTPGNTTAAYTYSVTTDNTGNTNMSLTGLVPGNYDVRVKNIRSLARKVNNVAIVSGANPLLNMGLLREGDTNNDNVVNLTDFSLLSATFGKCTGALGFDDRADYNRDTCVTIADFSLLSSNYGVTGQ